MKRSLTLVAFLALGACAVHYPHQLQEQSRCQFQADAAHTMTDAAIEALARTNAGNFNSQNFVRDYSRRLARGTIVQDARNIVRDVRRVEQRIGQGDGRGVRSGIERMADTATTSCH